MRFFASLFSITLVIALTVACAGYIALELYQRPSMLSDDINIVVKKGESLGNISQKLMDNHIIDYPIIIKFFAYYENVHTKIKAGEYAFPAHIAPREALAKMVSGDTVKHKITVIEGKTVYDTLEEIIKNDILTGDITETPQEGALLPETYLFERDTKRDDLIRRMQQDQEKFLTTQWTNRISDLPLATPKDALILASIVEKETGIASERRIIASVFINRLRLGMRLQSDPTIIYGITNGKGILERPIYRSDILNNQSGYNTYVIGALPPTPICNPSKEAIIAVLNPADTDYLFFVANDTGGHSFSKDLKGHNDNVQKWRIIEANKHENTSYNSEIMGKVAPLVIDKNIPIIKKQPLKDIHKNQNTP